MSDTGAAFVQSEIVAPRPAPLLARGFAGFAREHLFGSPLNIVLTITSALLLALLLVPTVKFMLIDAVWQGSDRNACLEASAGHAVGACWPFVQAKLDQFIYGFYPAAERWRVNLTFALGAALLLSLLIPRAPAKALNAALFFAAFPVVGFFLLRGGGLQGFAVSWLAELGNGLASSVTDAGGRLASVGQGMTDGALRDMLILLGQGITILGTALG